MGHTVLTFKGVDKLQKALKENVSMKDVKRVVRHNGQQLQRGAQRNADFRGHYEWKKGLGQVFVSPTGALKDSILLELKDGGMTAQVEPGMEYAAYVEFGTRFMDAQPYLKPAWEEQFRKFKQDLDRLME